MRNIPALEEEGNIPAQLQLQLVKDLITPMAEDPCFLKLKLPRPHIINGTY